MNAHVKSALLLVSTIFFAALVIVLAKVSLTRIPVFTFNWLQIAVAALFLLCYTFVWRREPWPRHLTLRQWLYPIAIGIANFTLVRYLLLAGLDYLPVTTHAYLVNFVGLITMGLSIFMLNERPYLLQLIGALIALSGLTIYFEVLPQAEEIKGIALVATGVFFLALTNNLIRRFMLGHSEALSAVMLSTLAIVIGGLPLIIWGMISDGVIFKFALYDWLVIFANGIIGLALTLIVFNHVMKTLRSYEASILASMGVVFVGVLAIPIAGEQLTFNKIVGIAILLLGILLSQLKITLKPSDKSQENL
ncbi:MAG: EamA family transporter [Gammaproteobacteria bacterium]|nr:EamA family transporter [Gammaproteobacteria bacterium]NVK87972.1 EamA family transporter [Gammaproteobacteria bacterium]